jgi:hypothetical protein
LFIGGQKKAGTRILKIILHGRRDLLPVLAAGKVSPVKGRPEPLPLRGLDPVFNLFDGWAIAKDVYKR